MDAAEVPAILLVMIDVDPADADELYRWYDEEHIPIRMELPGWARARRFLRADQPPVGSAEPGRLHLALYEVRSTAAFQTPEYAAQYVQQTPWSQRVTPTQRRVVRSYYRQVGNVPPAGAPAGVEAGAVVVAMFESVRPEDDVATWFAAEHAPAAAAVPGVRRVRHFVRTEVPWPGGKWMQPEAGRTHMLFHELAQPSALADPSWRTLLAPLLDGSSPVWPARPLAAGYALAADQRARSGPPAGAKR